MSIKLEYDRTELATDDIINVTATVTNNRPGKANMVIVDLGLPPGFTLIADKLNNLVDEGVIEKYSTTGRQIIVYLREVVSSRIQIGDERTGKSVPRPRLKPGEPPG